MLYPHLTHSGCPSSSRKPILLRPRGTPRPPRPLTLRPQSPFCPHSHPMTSSMTLNTAVCKGCPHVHPQPDAAPGLPASPCLTLDPSSGDLRTCASPSRREWGTSPHWLLSPSSHPPPPSASPMGSVPRPADSTPKQLGATQCPPHPPRPQPSP